MQRTQQSIRCGLTLIETIVAISIIGILAAIFIPAVQAVRESARKTQCQNNLKQTALALHAFHNSNNKLPSYYNGTSLAYPLREWDLFHMHSWRAALLPHIELSSLKDSIAWHLLATDRENESVATTVVSSYICPSGAAPSTSMGWGLRHGSMSVPEADQTQADKYPVVRSDYDALAGVRIIPDNLPSGENLDHTKYIRWGVWGWPTFDNDAISAGRLLRYREGSFRDVTDGLSNTIMLAERGGRPLYMVDGRPNLPYDEYPGQVGWSASNTFLWAVIANEQGINRDNAAGIYSDHAGGAYVALADGSVTFLSDSTDFATLAKMLGRSDGEL